MSETAESTAPAGRLTGLLHRLARRLRLALLACSAWCCGCRACSSLPPLDRDESRFAQSSQADAGERQFHRYPLRAGAPLQKARRHLLAPSCDDGAGRNGRTRSYLDLSAVVADRRSGRGLAGLLVRAGFRSARRRPSCRRAAGRDAAARGRSDHRHDRRRAAGLRAGGAGGSAARLQGGADGCLGGPQPQACARRLGGLRGGQSDQRSGHRRGVRCHGSRSVVLGPRMALARPHQAAHGSGAHAGAGAALVRRHLAAKPRPVLSTIARTRFCRQASGRTGNRTARRRDTSCCWRA